MRQKVFLFLCITFILTSLTACSGLKDEPIIGTWSAVSMKGEGEDFVEARTGWLTISCSSDGLYALCIDGGELSDSWKPLEVGEDGIRMYELDNPNGGDHMYVADAGTGALVLQIGTQNSIILEPVLDGAG